MEFPDEEAKLKSGPIALWEKEEILHRLGAIAQEKYDEFVVQGGTAKGYNLRPLVGSLQYTINLGKFDNDYYLEGTDSHWTDVAYYFEYGTGLYNQKRAGRYRAGYIRPTTQKYMSFVAKDGNFVVTDKVKGVHPVFAMEKAKKYVEFKRKMLQRQIRLEIQGE